MRIFCQLFASIALTAVMCFGQVVTTPRFDGAVVTRRGADIQGTIEARTVTTLEETATVKIARGARVTGDLIVAAEKKSKVGLANSDLDITPSSKATVDNRGGADGLRGGIRAIASFELPKVLRPAKPTAPDSAVVQGAAGAPADFSKVGNLTVRKPGIRIELPAGAYGNIVLAQGTVVLGVSGSTELARYEFRSLDVQAGGHLEVVGPVAVTIGTGAVFRGDLGNPAAPLWLDLRVAQGDIGFAGNATCNAFLTAPASTVTVSRGATLSGGAVSDQLVIEPGASVKGADADWSAAANEVSRPRFPQKALRVQAKVPTLRDGFKYSYYPDVTYIDDVPYLMLAEGKRPRNHPQAAYEEQRALFEALCTIFVDTGFDRGCLVLPAYSDDPTGRPPGVRNLFLTRQQFEAELAAAGKEGDLSANMVALQTDATQLANFVQRVLAIGLVASKSR